MRSFLFQGGKKECTLGTDTAFLFIVALSSQLPSYHDVSGPLFLVHKLRSQFSSSDRQKKRTEAEERARERESEQRKNLLEKQRKVKEERIKKQAELKTLKERKNRLTSLYAEERRYRSKVRGRQKIWPSVEIEKAKCCDRNFKKYRKWNEASKGNHALQLQHDRSFLSSVHLFSH